MIYNLNTDFFNKQFLPVTKRLAKAYAWGRVLLNGVQYVRDLFFDDYVNGSSDLRTTTYDAAITFNPTELVYYTDGLIYECILASTGNLPTNATYFTLKSFAVLDRIVFVNGSVYECILVNPGGLGALNTAYWIVTQTEFIGLIERTKANSQILLFEYILNKWYGTDFNYPSSTNDIYFTQGTAVIGFLMGNAGGVSSVMPNSSVYQDDYMSNAYAAAAGGHYEIHVPAVTFNALAGNDAERESVVRLYADRYNLAGITYTIVKY